MAAPWYSLSAMHELFEQLEKLKNADEKVALATLVNTRGTTPRKEGANLVLGLHFRPPAELAHLDDEAHPLEMLCRWNQSIENIG